MYLDWSQHWRKTVLLMVTIWEKQIFHSNYTWWSCSFFISAVITGVQMGEMPKLGWLIGWSSWDMGADSLYFLYAMLGSICKTLALFQHILWRPLGSFSPAVQRQGHEAGHSLMNAVALLVELLCYKPEGRGFDSRWGHWIFQFT
jgi:hypothetical protein